MNGWAETAKFPGMTRRGRPTTSIVGKYPNRIRAVRERRSMTQQDVAKAAATTHGTVGKLERGELQLKVHQLLAFARALKCDPARLLPDGGDNAVPVDGFIGQNATVQPYGQNHAPEATVTVECPLGLDPETTRALEVREGALFPIEDGWLLFYAELDGIAPDAIGHLCVVREHPAKPLVIRHLRRGARAGLYTLFAANAAPLENVDVMAASPVRACLPADLVHPTPPLPRPA